MLLLIPQPSFRGYSFIVYEPPECGLPWLSVRIGPHGKVLGTEAFASAADAEARTVKCARDFFSIMKLRELAENLSSV